MSHTGVLEIRGCAPAEWEYRGEGEHEKERLRALDKRAVSRVTVRLKGGEMGDRG